MSVLKPGLAAFASGVLFAAGLGISGMTQPDKVIGFLDLSGDWDPALVFVMAGGMLTYMALFPLITRRAEPILTSIFSVPTRRELTPRLVGGGVLFGVGWGIAGFCPGPAMTSLVTGDTSVIAFVAAMAVGMLSFRALSAVRFPQRQSIRAEAQTDA